MTSNGQNYNLFGVVTRKIRTSTSRLCGHYFPGILVRMDRQETQDFIMNTIKTELDTQSQLLNVAQSRSGAQTQFDPQPPKSSPWWG